MNSTNKSSFQDSVRIAFDRACNCLPGPSTVNNLFNLWEQHAYKKASSEKNQTVWRQRVLKKPKWEMVALLIPVLGQLIVGIHKLAKACFSKDKNSNDPIDISGFNRSGKTATSMNDNEILQLQIAIQEGQATLEDKYQLAMLLLKIPGKSGEAQSYMKQAADEKLGKAQFMLAEWNNPLSTTPSPLKKRIFDLNLYQQAADAEVLEAQFYLGYCYFTGHNGVAIDEIQAGTYLQLAAERNHPGAQFFFASLCRGQKNDQLAFKFYKKAAENRYNEANYYLADSYANGKGADRGLYKAKIYLDRSLPGSEVDELLAKVEKEISEEINRLELLYKPEPIDHYQLALLYSTAEENYEAAVKLMKTAANQGLSLAAYQLGEWNNAFSKMPSPIKFKEEAEQFNWYKAAADADDPIDEAQFQTGYCYLKGIGVEKNLNEAYDYLIGPAEDQNHVLAQYWLGTCLMELSKEIKDNHAVNAFEFYLKACENGCREAQASLGRCYLKGIGTDVDLMCAKLHFELALDSVSDPEQLKEIRQHLIEINLMELDKYEKQLNQSEVDD